MISKQIILVPVHTPTKQHMGDDFVQPTLDDAACNDVYCASYGTRYELLHVLFGLQYVVAVTLTARLTVEVEPPTCLATVRRKVFDLCTPFSLAREDPGRDDEPECSETAVTRCTYVNAYKTLSRFVVCIVHHVLRLHR